MAPLISGQRSFSAEGVSHQLPNFIVINRPKRQMFHSFKVKMQMESPHLAAGSGTQTRTRQCAPKKFKFPRPVLPSFAVGTLCHCRRSEEANGAIFLWAECLRVLNGRFLLFFVSIASTLQSIRRGWFDRSSRGRVATFF